MLISDTMNTGGDENMAIRRYKKPHLCKHVKQTFDQFVRTVNTCPNLNKWGNKKDLVDKKNCRECKYFELKESEVIK